MNHRTKDTYEKKVYDFIKDIDIVCPSCSKKAIVKSDSSLSLFKNIDKNLVRLICPNCGYNKLHAEIPKNLAIIKWTFIIGGAIDPYFHQPLWMAQKVGENILWAYNHEHLDFLERHVGAKLRERNNKIIENKSMGSRLPKWLTSKKNRELVLKVIKQLREK